MKPLVAGALIAAALLFAPPLAHAAGGAQSWPLLSAYVEHFVSPDGRVIDRSAGDVTTSEGQSYALFFALVAGDRALFTRLLRWTTDNLAAGRLDENLPAFQWGRRKDGSWGVLDSNSAADSDLWIGYVLVEAGRLWRDPALARTGRKLLARVVAREVAQLPGLGAMLLPAPRGFTHGARVRLNPSYLPLPLLRGLASEGVPGPWRQLAENTRRLVVACARHGFIADWVGFRPGRGFYTDPVKGAIGSYDAIRVYLWLALTDAGDPLRAALARRLRGPYDFWRAHGRVPERIDTHHPSQAALSGPVGFYAVLLPEVAASGDAEALRRLTRQIEESHSEGLYGTPPAYYDQNLILFSQGFVERRFRFSRDGRLQTAWEPSPRRSASARPP